MTHVSHTLKDENKNFYVIGFLKGQILIDSILKFFSFATIAPYCQFHYWYV